MRICTSPAGTWRYSFMLILLAVLLALSPDAAFAQRRADRDTPKPINERFKTMEGFAIEQALGTEAGSIVAMTFNEEGDIIASAEGGPLRLVRLAAAGTAAHDSASRGIRQAQPSGRKSADDAANRAPSGSVDSPQVTLFCDQVNNCQGILCYQSYVFAVGNGPSGTAFYRLKDKNADGTIDKTNDTIETLFRFKGGMGEHGPHQPVVGPDGLIYLMVGNHAWYGGEPVKSSPHHHYYEGDLFRPRYEDANGHASGIPVPGGQVYRFGIDGKNVELFCGGFRNAYDLAFNRDGELFTYDSDMEWDIGLPWYRPTRVNHLVPGGEYGWRSGSMKWPDYYVDSLGATIDIGRGSPTGVMFYEGDAYPERFAGDMFLTPHMTRQVILLGLKLRGDGGQQASMLLRRWTGERFGGRRRPPEETMASWQRWFAEKYPDEPEAKLPVDVAANKYTLDQLMQHLVARGEHGDRKRGALVFEKAQCVKCHRFGDRGEGIGPDLTNVSKRFQRKEILESVLYPSHVISDQFAGKTVTTSAGLQYTGLVAEQGQTLVVLTTTGEKINLNKSDVEEVAPSKVSAMPDGLFTNLSLDEISDLFAYLTTGAATVESALQSAPPAGWIELFNGRDLTGWVIEGTTENKKGGETRPVWSVQEGLIRCEGDGYGFLRFDRQFCDFVLHAEYRLTKGCNSGIGIRHAKFTGKSQTRPSYSGYEIQLLDDGGRQPTKGSSASLYRYVAPKSLPVKKPGEWNTINIECRGPRIKITLNGELVQDVDQSTIDDIKDKPLCGYISVQNHGKTIDFRNLRIKDLRSAQ